MHSGMIKYKANASLDKGSRKLACVHGQVFIGALAGGIAVALSLTQTSSQEDEQALSVSQSTEHQND